MWSGRIVKQIAILHPPTTDVRSCARSRVRRGKKIINKNNVVFLKAISNFFHVKQQQILSDNKSDMTCLETEHNFGH